MIHHLKKLKNPFALTTIVAERGTKVEVYLYNPKIEKEISESIEWADKMLVKGYNLKWPDGRTEAIKDEPIVDLEQSGSNQFEWDKSGNKIAFNRILIVQRGTASTKTTLKKVWKNFD